jgi:hypothetical protein
VRVGEWVSVERDACSRRTTSDAPPMTMKTVGSLFTTPNAFSIRLRRRDSSPHEREPSLDAWPRPHPAHARVVS